MMVVRHADKYAKPPLIVAALLWQSSSALEGLVDARRNVDRASSIRNITCSHVNLPVEDLNLLELRI